MEDGHLIIHDSERCLLAKVKMAKNRLYVLRLDRAQPVCMMAVHQEKEWLWHSTFGHLNFRALRDMSQNHMVEGLPLIKHVEQGVWDANNIACHSPQRRHIVHKHRWSYCMEIYVGLFHHLHQQERGISC